jgi:hypothetical protein
MAYAIVRTDKMFGTDDRNGMVSARYVVDTTETAIENGNVVRLDGLFRYGAGTTASPYTYEREIYKAVAPAANSALKDIVLVATPEVVKGDGKKGLENFRNEAGDAIRGYHLVTNDIFSVTKDALDGAATPAIGNLVELKAGTKLNVVASATGGSTQVGKIIAINVVGGKTFYVIQVG